MSTFADSARESTFPSANADRARAAPRGRHIRSAGRHVAKPLRHEERGVGNDGGRMHDPVLHMGGRETRGVSSVLPSCPDSFRASASLRRLARVRPASRCRKTWMPGTSPLLSGLTSERALCRQARPSPPPCCHPGLDPGSRLAPDFDPGKAGRGRCLWLWTPDQVRGDNRGTRTAGDGGPRSVSRSGGRAGNPPVPTPCTGSTKVKPDSNGTSPGMTGWGRTGRCARRRKGAPASAAPPLVDSGKYSLKRVPSQGKNARSNNIYR